MIHNFEDFLNEKYNKDVNEGIKDWAAAGMMGLASLGSMNAAASDKVPDNTVTRTYQTSSETKRDLKIEQGWTLDSTVVKTMIEETETEINIMESSLNLEQNFESGSWKLTESGQKSIDSLMNAIQKDGYIISNIQVESSTDKTPISTRMTQKTGIKTNKELSQKRNQSIINYLSEKGYLGNNEVESNVLSEQGGENDVSARYVTLNVTSAKTDIKPGREGKEKTMYYFSKTHTKKSPQKTPHMSKSGAKLKGKTFQPTKAGKLEAVKCAKVF